MDLLYCFFSGNTAEHMQFTSDEIKLTTGCKFPQSLAAGHWKPAFDPATGGHHDLLVYIDNTGSVFHMADFFSAESSH